MVGIKELYLSVAVRIHLSCYLTILISSVSKPFESSN